VEGGNFSNFDSLKSTETSERHTLGVEDIEISAISTR